MKRTWAYVASFVPFTSAMSSAAMALGGGLEEIEQTARRATKENPENEEEDAESSGEKGNEKADGGGVASGAPASSHASAVDAGETLDTTGDGGQTSGGGGHGPDLTRVENNDGMYAPASGGHVEGVTRDDGSSAYTGPASIGGFEATQASEATRETQETDSSNPQPPEQDDQMPSETIGDDPAAPVAEDPEMTDQDPNETTDQQPEEPGNQEQASDLDPEDTGYVEPDPVDADAMSILLGGTATGAGYGATASGEVDLDIVDYGGITVGYGYASYLASGSEGGIADTYAAVTGADKVYTFGFDFSHWNESQSLTYVVALDFEEDALAEYWGGLDGELFAQSAFGQWMSDQEEDVSVDGNISQLSLTTTVQDDGDPASADGSMLTVGGIGSIVTAWAESEQASLSLSGDAVGADTLTSASGSLLEVEDQFSSVSGAVIAVA